MSTVNTAFSAITNASCSEIVIDLTETVLSTANLGTEKGFLNAVTSPQNVGSFELRLDPNKERPTDSSVRKVYTSDTIPLCNQDTEAAGACATPSYSADDVAANFKAVEHRVEESIQRKIVMDVEAFKAFCLSPQEYLAKRLLAFRDGVIQEINSKLVTKAVAYEGLYADGVNSLTNPKNVSFLTSNTFGGYIFDPTGYAAIKDEYSKIGHPFSTPFIVGGSHANYLRTVAGFMNGSNLNGVTSAVIPNLFVDYAVDTTIADGNNNLITWAPGAIQVVGYNDVSDTMVQLSVPMHREKMRVPDPFGTGINSEWDFYFNVDESGCKYELRWELFFDLIVPVPYDGTCAKKPILGFTVDCEGNVCPDSGSGTGSGV